MSKSKPKIAFFQNRNLTTEQTKTMVTLQSGYKSINTVPSQQPVLSQKSVCSLVFEKIIFSPL
jgi:hypothetical protein